MGDWRSRFTSMTNNPEGWKRYEEEKQKRKLERLEKQKIKLTSVTGSKPCLMGEVIN